MIVDERALVAAVRELAAEKPDFVYEAPGRGECKYVHRTPEGHLVGGCIVGQAALKVGMPIEVLAELDDSEEPQVEFSFRQFELGALALRWLHQVQFKQDLGERWGSAVLAADRVVGDPFA
ncbi:hypothetical protein A5N75_08210 [Prescottella equi]|uniref:hypothetical protein n=1 Tax=Rhodococcus hoagii TaxID=43767 RepID=UPI000A254349|nr:hypothetical protein [Prescottella equi]ORL77804.1 hypothetical protein A5N75_08210 [Prescottella equi]